MARLPVVSGRELIAALGRVGYEQDRQRGSHVVLRQAAAPHRRVTVPDHRKIRKGTLKAILRHVGLTVDELLELLK